MSRSRPSTATSAARTSCSSPSSPRLIAAHCEFLQARAADLDDPIERLHLYVTDTLSTLVGSRGTGAGRFITSQHWRLHELYPDALAAGEPSRSPTSCSASSRTARAAGLLAPREPERDAWIINQLVMAVFHYYAFAGRRRRRHRGRRRRAVLPRGGRWGSNAGSPSETGGADSSRVTAGTAWLRIARRVRLGFRGRRRTCRVGAGSLVLVGLAVLTMVAPLACDSGSSQQEQQQYQQHREEVAAIGPARLFAGCARNLAVGSVRVGASSGPGGRSGEALRRLDTVVRRRDRERPDALLQVGAARH